MFQQGHTDLWVWWGVWRMGLLALSSLVPIYNLKLTSNLFTLADFVISSKYLFSTFLNVMPALPKMHFSAIFYSLCMSSLKSYIGSGCEIEYN